MSDGWLVYVVPLKHCKANILSFLLKLCNHECGWSKF